MKRKYLFMLPLLFLSFGSLVGCNGNSDPNKPLEITASTTNIKLNCGNSSTVTFTHETVKDATADVTFSDPAVATAYKIGDSYTVYGVKVGETVMTYSYSNGKAGVGIKIIPKDAKTYVEINNYSEENFTTYKGKEVDLSSTFYLDGFVCSSATFQYEVTEGNGVINDSGIFTSSSNGDSTIRITPSYAGISYAQFSKEISISVADHYNEINNASYKYIGRTISRIDGGKTRVDFDNVNSGIEFAFFGSSVKALIKDVSLYPSDLAGRAKIMVDGSIDGNYLVLASYGSVGNLEIKGLSDCYHTAKIVNCFEEGFIPTISDITKDIKIDEGKGKFAVLDKTKEKSMLVIGDSISSGFDAVYSSGKVDCKSSDSTFSYPYQTAQMLNFDLDVVASQGIGVRYGFRDNNLASNQYMLNLYTKNSIYDLSTPYDRSQKQYDVVVINMGTNDATFLDKYDADKSFQKYYEDLLKLVINDNLNSVVFPIFGMMSVEPIIKAAIVAACEAVKTEVGFNNIYPYFDFVATTTHPLRATHTQNAEILAQYILTTLASL